MANDWKDKKDYNATLSGFVFDKLPPQAVDVEQAVLGGLLIDHEVAPQIMNLLKEADFYTEANKKVFGCVVALFQRSAPIDIVTVVQEARKQGVIEDVGGAHYIGQLPNRVGSTANIESHARLLIELSKKRAIIQLCNNMLRAGYDDTVDVFDLEQSAQKQLHDIIERGHSGKMVAMSDLYHSRVKELRLLDELEVKVVGVPSGFPALDNVTGGAQKTELIIFAARPGMGKTSWLLDVVKNAAVRNKVPVAFFSLEMGKTQLMDKMIASEAPMLLEHIRRNQMQKDDWDKIGRLDTREDFTNAPIYIDDTAGLNIFELRAKARTLKMKHNIGMIVVDYLQLMSGKEKGTRGGNREQEISTISRQLKVIAKELDIPVIALSQLSRAVETRGGDKRPQLSDLRESGSIEQDADMVLFLYRPEYYGFDTDEDGNSTQGLAEVIIAKNRNGPLDTVKLRWEGQFTRFRNWDSDFEDSGGGELTPLSELVDRQGHEIVALNGRSQGGEQEVLPF